MKALMLAPLLLAACTGSWPAGSYVQASNADAGVLAPAVSDCLSAIVQPHAVISLASTDDPASAVIVDVVARSGLALQPNSDAVSYVISPLDAGEFIRVTAPHGACSQYFSRASGTLKADGPLMVIMR